MKKNCPVLEIKCKTMATSDLTNDQNANYALDVKLCRAVQAHPFIYDHKHPMLKETYDKAWQTIAKVCEDTVPSCKLRWRSIRKGFTRYKQTTGSKKRHASRARGYYLQDALEFFIPHIDGGKCSDTEDDIEMSLEKHKVNKKIKSKSVSPQKRCFTPGEERTKSADENVEVEKKSPSIEQISKVGIFIVPTKCEDKKSKTTETVKTNESAVDGAEAEAVVFKANHIDLTAKTAASVEEASSTPAEPVEPVLDARPNRFRRACKRSLDKTVVQELRNSSPKCDVEPKRTRRSLSARSTTLKPESKTEVKSEDKTLPKMSATPTPTKKKQEKLDKPALQQSPTSSSSMDQLLTIIPSDFVETKLKRSSLSEPRVLLNSSVECAAPLSPTLVMMVEPSKCDQAVQCDQKVESLSSDDNFLNMLRPQMGSMNARQKLNFMQKVYMSMIEVFDNAANFPGADELGATPPAPLPAINAPNSAEMCLIRELASMVQAAKSSSVLLKPLEPSSGEKACAAETVDAASQTFDSPTTIINEKGQPVLSLRYAVPVNPDMPDGGETRQFVRKIVKVNGAFATQEGDKRRVYRVLPKGVVPHKIHDSSNGVGTFIIPRTPGSIASSVNAAVAAGASASSSTLASQNIVYRQIGRPAGKAFVSPSSSNLLSGSLSPGLRAMAVRSTIRPPGTSVPRQMVRRYSVAGSANISPFDRPKTTNIITTTVNTPPSIAKPTITSAMRPEMPRFVRATTFTPPFKHPAAPTTAAASPSYAANTKIAVGGAKIRHSISHSLTRNQPDQSAKNLTTSPPSTLVSAKIDNFFDALLASTSSSATSSSSFASPGTSLTSTSNSNSPSEDPLGLQNNSKEGSTNNISMKPKGKNEHSDYTISSDNFNGIDIKDEPIDD